MQNGSFATSSIGQQSETESYTSQVNKDWSQISPPVRKLNPTANQIVDSTEPASQTITDRDIVGGRVFVPQPFTVSSTSRLRTKQSWEGVVISCNNGTFIARVTDRTNPDNPEEVAEFEASEVSDDDRALIRPGASFYWTIGTERYQTGTIKNVAFVNFRRTPRWSKTSLQKAANRAASIAAILEQE